MSVHQIFIIYMNTIATRGNRKHMRQILKRRFVRLKICVQFTATGKEVISTLFF